jgi:predicted NUDIX family NTP pyrophosphohydrolase
MSKQSAGILLYRRTNLILEVLLVHPGGPFFKQKDLGVWSVPKGEFRDDEDPLTAAIREFKEETGVALIGSFVELNAIRQKGGKTVYCWALESDLKTNTIVSNKFTIEWPPKSNKMQEYPEVDKAEWFTIEEAMKKIIPAQTSLLTELDKLIK